MNYIGVDYHKKYSYMAMKKENGRVEGRGTVNNTKEEINWPSEAKYKCLLGTDKNRCYGGSQKHQEGGKVGLR